MEPNSRSSSPSVTHPAEQLHVSQAHEKLKKSESSESSSYHFLPMCNRKSELTVALTQHTSLISYVNLYRIQPLLSDFCKFPAFLYMSYVILPADLPEFNICFLGFMFIVCHIYP